MITITSNRAAAMLMLAAASLTANAEPVEKGDSGHYYEVEVSPGISWDAANTLADGATVTVAETGLSGSLGLAGYLATITSADENDFLHALRMLKFSSEAWVGGHQYPTPCSPEPVCNWIWSNGEGAIPGDNNGPAYANWLAGEPNDNTGPDSESHLAIGLGNQNGWNDEGALGNIGGYVVEYEVVIIARDDPTADGPNDPIKASSGVMKNIKVQANDWFANAVDSVEIISGPASGGTSGAEVHLDSAVGDPKVFSINYTSDTTFEGTDTFEYQVTDVTGASATATVTVEVSADEAVVGLGVNQLFFNQAGNPVPGGTNPMTAGYKQVLNGGEVTIDCCRVLDTREGAGKGKKFGSYLPSDFDLGKAVADTLTNPSCVGMPQIPEGSAILRPWQRGVPRSQGYDPAPALPDFQENQLGVCLIQADVESRGVVFSVEEAKNVVGYKLDCKEPTIKHRPFTGGVSLDPLEVDAPYVTRWTAECDESRSGKRFSDNVMVVNLWHDTDQNGTQPYLARLASALKESIESVRLEGCVENNDGFVDALLAKVESAKRNMNRNGDHQAAVEMLDAATKDALLLGSPEGYDPYGSCPGNPEGLFVGRLMSLKFAACSELLHADSSSSSLDGACMIDEEIQCALPELPGFPHPDSCTAPPAP